MTILFLARSLLRGGSERQLVLLASELAARGERVSVALFYADGPLVKDLERSGVDVVDLGKAGRWDVLFLGRLMAAVWRLRPDIIHGYLPVANILAVLAKIAWPRARVVFGVRAGPMQLSNYDRLSALSYWIEGKLARWCTLAIANSHQAKQRALLAGYPPERVKVIPNGIDSARFRPDAAARDRFRRRLGIGQADRLIGMVARLDPMKDHQTFLAAAAILASRLPSAHFVCIGDGPKSMHASLDHQAELLGLGGRLTWLAGCDDVQDIYPGLDVLVSSSVYGEGFSNVLGEAMASGVPCVATDVGDARLILGEICPVVPPGDPAALAEAIWTTLIEPERAHEVRQRVVENFSVNAMVQSTGAALAALVERPSNE